MELYSCCQVKSYTQDIYIVHNTFWCTVKVLKISTI
jgi:hypothetical protein